MPDYEAEFVDGVIEVIPKNPYLPCCKTFLIQRPKRLIIIDPGNPKYMLDMLGFIDKGLGVDLFQHIDILVTHLHTDHVGDPTFLHDARFYASPEEIEEFEKHPADALHIAHCNPDGFNGGRSGLQFIRQVQSGRIKLESLDNVLDRTDMEEQGYTVVPGHTPGSTVYVLGEHIFLGDTLYREDTPTKMETPKKLRTALVSIIRSKNAHQGHPSIKQYRQNPRTAA